MRSKSFISIRNLLLMGVVTMTLGTQALGLDVKVVSHDGVPQIHIDGQPVRGRMFFGIPGRSALPIGPEPRLVEFEFRAIEDELAQATMHFRFGETAGEIVIDNVRVVEVDTGREVIERLDFEDGLDTFRANWHMWPNDERNTVALLEAAPGVGSDGSDGLKVRIVDPPDGIWPSFHIFHEPNLQLHRGKSYRVSFNARADQSRDLQVEFYRPGQPFTKLGMPPGCFEEQVRLAGDVDVDFVSFPIHVPWFKPGTEANYSAVDAVCRLILDANPDALLLPRIPVEPPGWWKEKYPDHVMVWEDGTRPRGFAVASEQYRRDAATHLGNLVRHLEATFGDSIAGYHPSGHNTGEWFYQETWSRKYHGYSPVTRDAWREWLKRTYQTEARLRQAWGRSDASFQTAEVPTPESMHSNLNGLLRDPVAERSIIDFNLFEQEMMADCVGALAKAVREASNGEKLVVFFYGYVFEFAAAMTGPAISGHYALSRALECPDIDVLCSPISYFDRGLAESAPIMTAAESVALAGKLWLSEDDTATFLSSGNFPGHTERVDTLEGTSAQLIRNVAQNACRNLATWWMDLGGTGWFNDARLWEVMRRLEAIDMPLLKDPVAFRPAVAAVVDETSMMFVGEQGHLVTRPLVFESRGEFGRMGTPYGQYLLDDVCAGKTDAGLYVFLTAWSLTGDQREALRRTTAGKGRVWCYAPGLFDGFARNPQAARDLTGFDLRPVSGTPAATAEITEVGRRLGLTTAITVEKPIQPLFTVQDTQANEVLATYPNGEAAIVLRRGKDNGFDLFVGVPRLSAELLRLAAKTANVHLFTEDECVVFANGRFVALHATQDGPVRLNFGPRDGETQDVLTGERIGKGPKLTLDLRRGDSRILRLRDKTSE